MLNAFLILRFGLPKSPYLSHDSKITTNSHVNLAQTAAGEAQRKKSIYEHWHFEHGGLAAGEGLPHFKVG